MSWEDICRRCGLCCFSRTIYPDEVVVDLSSPCSFLDTATLLCTVYEERFDICSECTKVTPLTAILGTSLPPSCAYIEWARRHRIRLRHDKPMAVVDELRSSD